MSNFLRKNKFLLLVGAVVLSVAIGAAFYVKQTAKKDAPANTNPVIEFESADLVRAETRELVRTLPLTGTLNPLNEAVVKAKVAGEIRSLTVREGDSVHAGQVIGRIDATEVQAKLAGSEADVEAARSQFDVAEKNRTTQQTLLERKFISQNAFDTTKGNADVAQAKLKAAQANAAVSRKSVNDAVLITPIDGIVSLRHAQLGERVMVDGKVVSVVDLRKLELEAPIATTDVAAVQVNQSVRFHVEGFGDREFVGRIARINPTAGAGTRSISLYAVIDNADGSLKGGMFAKGELIIGSIPNALVVPASAVREERGERYVYVIENNKVVRRVVTVVSQTESTVQIATGLAPETQVVRYNLGSLREGADVRVKPSSAAPNATPTNAPNAAPSTAPKSDPKPDFKPDSKPTAKLTPTLIYSLQTVISARFIGA